MTSDQIQFSELGISIDDAYAQQLEAASRVMPPANVEDTSRESIRCGRNDRSEQLQRAGKLAAENAELRQCVMALELALIVCILSTIALVCTVAALHNPRVHALALPAARALSLH